MAGLEELLKRYYYRCACRGDQYGGWGPCELCKEYVKLTAPPKPKVTHLCGVQGFDQMRGDVCPACEVEYGRT